MMPSTGPGHPARPLPVARGSPESAQQTERISLTFQTCGRHASYIDRGAAPPRDSTMDPRTA